MRILKNLKMHFMLISLSGVIFAASTPRSVSSIHSSSATLVPQTLQGFQPVPTANDETTPATPEWAKKLYSEVESIKKTQEHILAILQPQNRRVKFPDFATTEEAVQASTSPSRRESFPGFEMAESIGFDSSAGMTAEQQEAAHIARINGKNQQRADRQRQEMAMGIAAQKSFREERRGDSDCDLESDSGDRLDPSPSEHRPQTGKFAEKLRRQLADDDSDFPGSDSQGHLELALNERPQTGNLAGNLRHRVLSARDPNIE